MNRSKSLIIVAGAGLWSVPAASQNLDVGLEASTNEVRRGLSWSQDRASISGDAIVTSGQFEVFTRVAALRSSKRHDGSDAVLDLSVGHWWDLGAVRLRADATGHLFVGAQSNMDFAEIGLSASYSYGPLELTGGAALAPSQSAIGGNNLHLFVAAQSGIPSTPLTLNGRFGRSTGTVDDTARAQRLRPGGGYMDWRLGIEHRRQELSLGIEYVGTDASLAVPSEHHTHFGDQIIAKVRLAF